MLGLLPGLASSHSTTLWCHRPARALHTPTCPYWGCPRLLPSLKTCPCWPSSSPSTSMGHIPRRLPTQCSAVRETPPTCHATCSRVHTPVAVLGAIRAKSDPPPGTCPPAPRDSLLAIRTCCPLGSGRPCGPPRKSSFSLSCSEVGSALATKGALLQRDAARAQQTFPDRRQPVTPVPEASLLTSPRNNTLGPLCRLWCS